MRLVFFAFTSKHAVGGVAVIYSYANAMAARGHQVDLFHVAPVRVGSHDGVQQLADIPWFSFGPGITHHFGPANAEAVRARADIVFAYESSYDDPTQAALPVVFIQGYQMFHEAFELAAFRAPCLKVCVAQWLVDVGVSLGVPREQLVHIPCGLDHDQFRLLRPIAGRAPLVSFCYNPHWQKGAEMALEVLESLKRSLPQLEAAAFGFSPRPAALPGWVSYRTDPPRRELIEDVYNRSRVFLCTSTVEGFGLTCVESMACGAALATTDNGGSRDYAIQEHTALVSAPGDVGAMVDNALRLLEDDRLRTAVATQGQQLVQRFTWSSSADQLEHALTEYLRDPIRHGRPAR